MDDQTRLRHIAHVHAVAADIGLEGDAYRDWMEKRTRQRSCKDLTDAELAALAQSLKATRPQWQKVYHLAREIGFSGFDDAGFKTFVKRITKADDPRLLSKPQLRNLIAGLTRWAASKRKRATTPNTDS